LSYTHFAYSDLVLAQDTLVVGKSLALNVTLTNAGALDADEVAQLYLSDLEASAPVPLHKLVGLQRVHLRSGESKTLEFTVTPEMMTLVNENGEPQLEPGQFRVTVGGCSPGARGVALGAPEPVSAVFALDVT
jgi:beta-glucosidase